ncbi:hypothetical protein ACFE04_016169 [Oxalis oulophora]
MENSNSNSHSKKVAVLVGCNYAHTQNELHGCINDVIAMRETLVKRFGFELSNIELLTDANDGSNNKVLPTGANIKAALNRMIDRAHPGDVLYFHYSGHGTRIPSLKPGHPFRSDEAIVPCDFNLITDVDFRELVNRIPKGTSFTILSDSCHSGGLIDKEKEQIGPLASIQNNICPITNSSNPKSITFESLLQHFQSLTKINTTDIATLLLQSFGRDSSLKFRLSPLELEDAFGPFGSFKKSDEGILLSGCQANETSADMNPQVVADRSDGKAYGAFSNAVQEVVKGQPVGRDLSNREVVMGARDILRKQGFEQHPCLYCSDENVDAIFLGQSTGKVNSSL